ncbi:MAG: hypothetical protein NTZ45_00115 [Methylococcales bacterium]|nr:hypothetical protein [Methylococcales bacterium]
MFRHRPKIVLKKPLDNGNIEPINGFFFLANQACLKLGIERKSTVDSRPVLSMRKRNDFVIVLPLTTKEGKMPLFYPLTENEVKWKRSNDHISYLCRNYETVSYTNLYEKIGLMAQNTRMDITKWLNDFYGDAQ